MFMRVALLSVLASVTCVGQSRTRVEKEAALGQQLASEFQKHSTGIASSGAQHYVESLGQKLALRMPRTAFRFTFSIMAEDLCPAIHEPAVFPGGYVFVPEALFAAAQDETEFAGMLAHAMAHIVEHHGIQQATRGELTASAGVPLVFRSGIGCSSGSVVRAGGLAPPAGFLKFQRTLESKADLLALESMAATGFDPNALVRYTGRVQLPVAKTRAVFSPLPRREERIASMASAIAKLPPATFSGSATGEFEAARDEIRRLRPASPPARSDAPSLERNRSE